jgi:hypothetical protein
MSATAPHPYAARHAVHIELSDEDKAALWAMSLDQRITAMWAGELSHGQLLEWTHVRPDQVPSLGGEIAWLMMFTPEFADAAEQHRNNVVRLPERSQARAAA